MIILILGVLLWAVVHWMPRLNPALKNKLLKAIGENAYKGIFSLLIVTALILIVLGWRSTEVTYLYTLPSAFRHISMLLMLVAFILFGSAKAPVRIKRFIRHPQLMSVVVWSIAHLLVNGDIRSIILFAGMGVWASVQMFLINKQEPQYLAPEAAPWAREVKVLIISVLIMMVAMYAHQWFAGVSLFRIVTFALFKCVLIQV